MTTVHVSMARDDGTGTLAALPGSLYWEPTTRREDGTVVVLPVGFAMSLTAGEATKDVEPSGLTWCWRVTERVEDGTVRYVAVPDSAETVEYTDLVDVDPDTLVAWTPADPEAAYTAALAAKVDEPDAEGTDGQALTTDGAGGRTWTTIAGGVTSVDEKTGAVSLSDTYVAQFTQDDTPAAPAEGTSQTYFVTSAVSWPAGLEWSTDPDGGVAPTITGTALVSLFTYGGVTRAVLGATFPALPAETTPPTAGTLGVVMGVTTADLTVTGADDETALAAAPYAFTMDGGTTWTVYQSGATYQYTGLDPSTSYTFQHRVIDAADNVSTGTAVTDSTAADVTGPTAGTLAVVPTSTTAGLTVSGASDDVALDAAPYAYSSDGGTTYTAWQAGATYEFTGLTPNTSYDFRHKVRDAAGNESEGAIATTSTGATPSDTTAPTAGTLAGSSITSTGFTLTVTGATDETALDATPYAFSTDNGSTYSAWQASNVYAASGLTAETGYQCVHKVRDAALNVSTGTPITVTTTTAWTPASLPGLAGWWDASDVSTITEVEGKVSQLDDKSTNARHMSQATAEQRPTAATGINGLTCISVAAATSITAGLSSSPGVPGGDYTVYSVHRYTNAQQYQPLVVAAGIWSGYPHATTFRTYGTAAIESANTNDQDAHIHGSIRDTVTAADSAYRIDGVETNSTLGGSGSSALIGSNATGAGAVTGLVGEMVVCTGALGASDIGALESYLSGKWGVAVS